MDRALAEFEISLIKQAIGETKNLTAAARRLGISKQALNYKMNKYQMYK